MPKPPKADRPIEKNISLPQSMCIKVDLILFSELEQRVPHGAWARYVQNLIEADLEKRAHDAAYFATRRKTGLAAGHLMPEDDDGVAASEPTDADMSRLAGKIASTAKVIQKVRGCSEGEAVRRAIEALEPYEPPAAGVAVPQRGRDGEA